jgi:hypothetical protein
MTPDFHALFSYEPDTGYLRWRKNVNPRARVGDIAGTPDVCGRRVQLHKKLYRVHRIIWFMHTGEWPNVIDHINGDPHDNRLGNLRDTDVRGNNQNRDIHRAGKLVGAYPQPSGRWLARIRIDGEDIRLGTYPTEKRAFAVYAAAATLHKFNQGVLI